MPPQWGLGVPQGNAGEAFQQSYQNALVQRQQQEDRQIQMQQRDAEMERQRQQQQFQLTDRHRQDIRLGAGIARQYEQRSGRPMDEAGWQAVRAAAQQAGADLTGVPEHFDPQYYQGLLAAGAQIEAQAQRQQAPTTLQRNDEYIRSQYGDTAGDQYVSRQVAPPPITQHNADGTITIIPQAGAPVHRRGQQQGGAFQDGDTEVINGVTYVRQGGHWVPASNEAPAFRPAPGGPAPGQGNFQP